MENALLQEAESAIRGGLTSMEGERLRGQVQVVQWSAIKEAMRRSLEGLRGEVERLEAEKAARAAPTPAELAAMDLVDQVKHLLEKVARLEKQIIVLESALDYMDLAEVFDLEKFAAACEKTRVKVEKLPPASADGETSSPPFLASVIAMQERAKTVGDRLSTLMELMNRGQADIGVVVKTAKLSKEGEGLWRELALVEEATAALSAAPGPGNSGEETLLA